MSVAAAHAPSGDAGGVVLALPPRMCVELQVDNVRRLRAGPSGLVRTRALQQELVRSLGLSPGSRGSMANDCPRVVDDEDARAALGQVVATPAIVSEVRRAGARRAIVTEITTRLVCHPFYVDDEELDAEQSCFEDAVSVSALVFDEHGRATQVASAPLVDEERVAATVRALLGALPLGARGSVGVPGICRFMDNHVDCT